ncbi:unnamed protein product [Clavelina lepadiformis]|uniref:Uncharacterized protein n=1 Tax=Clavelina lepadiformis TaxID=159417 RepID=A0ABP0FAL3_CLALP
MLDLIQRSESQLGNYAKNSCKWYKPTRNQHDLVNISPKQNICKRSTSTLTRTCTTIDDNVHADVPAM